MMQILMINDANIDGDDANSSADKENRYSTVHRCLHPPIQTGTR